MLDALLTLFDYDFMRRALLAVLLVMPLFSLLGTLVVNNGMAFFSDALGHSALTGVGIGVIFGMAEPGPAMVLFAVAFALLMNRIRHSRLSSSSGCFPPAGWRWGWSSCPAAAFPVIKASSSGTFSRSRRASFWCWGSLSAWWQCFGCSASINSTP